MGGQYQIAGKFIIHNFCQLSRVARQGRLKVDYCRDRYSEIRIHKQSISKEINNAEHEYMNIWPPNY